MRRPLRRRLVVSERRHRQLLVIHNLFGDAENVLQLGNVALFDFRPRMGARRVPNIKLLAPTIRFPVFWRLDDFSPPREVISKPLRLQYLSSRPHFTSAPRTIIRRELIRS
jgi:hypothetical protein